jgi:uncharacterized membrane protein
MVSLVVAASFFAAIHLFVSGTGLRDRIVGMIGERVYQGLFSLLSLVGIVWLSRAYGQTSYLPLWGELYSLKPVVLLLMVIASLFVAIGLTTPNPTAVGGESRLDEAEPASGILRVTRHPFLWGVAIWAFAHLVVNGDAASLVLFGSLLVVAVAGPRSIDAKRARRFGAKWERFAGMTSNVPFLAITQGRNRLDLAEIGWWRIGAGLVVFVALVAVHEWLFGVSPLP